MGKKNIFRVAFQQLVAEVELETLATPLADVQFDGPFIVARVGDVCCGNQAVPRRLG